MRELTTPELNCISLLTIFEEACDQHRLTASAVGAKPAVDILYKLEAKHKVLKVLKVEPLKDIPDKYRIIFNLHEFNKYLRFMLSVAELKLYMDGSLQAKDGLIIPNTYLKSHQIAG